MQKSRRSVRFIIVSFAVTCLIAISAANAQDAGRQTPTPTTTASAFLTHTVQSGETLSGIASRYGVTVGELTRVNSITNPALIQIGQRLQIPDRRSTPAPAQTPTPDITQPPPIDPSTDGDAQATGIPFDATSAPARSLSAFGIELYASPDLDVVTTPLTDLAPGWIKITLDWAAAETIDPLFAHVADSNARLLVTLTGSPSATRPTQPTESAPPDDLNAFADFAADIAQRYGSRIDAYEIWREPNLRREWNSITYPLSPESYFRLLQVTIPAIRQHDDAPTIAAGLAPTGLDDGFNAIADRRFLRDLIALGAADLVDGFGIHPFGFANPPDSLCCAAPAGVTSHFGHPSFYFAQTLQDYRDILDAAAVDKPLWVTQFGWGSAADAPANYRYVTEVTETQQADYTTNALAQLQDAIASGSVAVVIVSNLNGCQSTLANPELCYYSAIQADGTFRPLYDALGVWFGAQ